MWKKCERIDDSAKKEMILFFMIGYHKQYHFAIMLINNRQKAETFAYYESKKFKVVLFRVLIIFFGLFLLKPEKSHINTGNNSGTSSKEFGARIESLIVKFSQNETIFGIVLGCSIGKYNF